MSKVFIVGQGYVGLTVAKFAAEKFSVIGFDSNESLVENLNMGKSHIEGIASTDLQSLVKVVLIRLLQMVRKFPIAT